MDRVIACEDILMEVDEIRKLYHPDIPLVRVNKRQQYKVILNINLFSKQWL